MTVLKTLSVAAAALALSSGAALAQTPYGSSQTQTQPNRQQEAIGAILGALFGDRLGVSTSIDAQWAAGRMPLNTQRAQFDSRVEADVRSGALSTATGARLRADYEALVQLESRYGADRRFTTQERAELNERYTALTNVLTQGGYAGGEAWTSVIDGRSEFDARVDTAVRNRRLTRAQGTRLKADYAALVTVEAGYMRDGSLSAREQEDLETRLDALDVRVGDIGYGQPIVVDLRTRLLEIERAAAGTGIGRPQAEQIRTEVGDLMRLEAAYARMSPSADDRAYLDRRVADLEVRARINR